MSQLQTLSDVANRLQVSVRTVYRLEGFPSPIRFGRLVRWRVEDVEAWVAAVVRRAPRKQLGRPRGSSNNKKKKRPGRPRNRAEGV